MASSSGVPNNDEDIRVSLDSIIGISERWLSFLSRRQKRVRLAQAFLTTVLVCVGSVAVVLAVVLEQDSLAFFPRAPWNHVNRLGVPAFGRRNLRRGRLRAPGAQRKPETAGSSQSSSRAPRQREAPAMRAKRPLRG
jgi:hypothetical protein